MELSKAEHWLVANLKPFALIRACEMPSGLLHPLIHITRQAEATHFAPLKS